MMMSQPSIFWWQKYGTLAQMAQAAVALLSFVAILFQINEIRTNNRAAGARQAFLGYTDLAFRNPKFSHPDYDAMKPYLPVLCERYKAGPAYLTTYSTDTQEWVKASMKSASVAPPDCKLGKT
jgi:hypothetical protein